jgi:hypothetical protein
MNKIVDKKHGRWIEMINPIIFLERETSERTLGQGKSLGVFIFKGFSLTLVNYCEKPLKSFKIWVFWFGSVQTPW